MALDFDLFQPAPEEEDLPSESVEDEFADVLAPPPDRPRRPVEPDEPEEDEFADVLAPPPDRAPEPAPPPVEAPPPPPVAVPSPAPPREEIRITREERAAFRRWLQNRRFVNPRTQHRVLYRSLPAEEQARIRDAWLKEYRERGAPQLPSKMPEGAEIVKSLGDFQKGDRFFEAENMKAGPLTVREVRSRPKGGKVLVAENGISYYEDEVQRHADGGFIRFKAKKPEPETKPEIKPEIERPYGPVEDLAILQSGDVISIDDENGQKQYYYIRKMSDGMRADRLHSYGVDTSGIPFDQPHLRERRVERLKIEELPEKYRRRFQYPIPAIYTEVIQDPGRAKTGTCLKADKTYKVVRSAEDYLMLQEYDPESQRFVERPKKVTVRDLQRTDYRAVRLPEGPRRKPPGKQLATLAHLREGRVVKITHRKSPIWARVEKNEGGKVTLQPLNSRTGRPTGEPEILTEADLKEWADLRTLAKRPRKIPYDRLVGRRGEEPKFAEPGKGELEPNFQPHRYETVKFVVYGPGNQEKAKEKLKELLGDYAPEGVDLAHFAADLAGCGGVAESLTSINVSVGMGHISVEGRGPGITRMTRSLFFKGDGKPAYISNGYFRVRGAKRTGKGTKMLATQVATARKAGFERIITRAAGHPRSRQYRGYYAWPALGYDGDFPSDVFHDMPEALQERIREIHPKAPKDLRFVHVMSAGDEARKWWKDHGRSHDAKFELKEGSPSLMALTEYVQGKAANLGMGADEFLQHAASLIRRAAAILGGELEEDEFDGAPEFTAEDEKILSRVWAKIGDVFRAKVQEAEEKKEIRTKTGRVLVQLAFENNEFLHALASEMRRSAIQGK